MAKKPKDTEISFTETPAPDEVEIPEQREHFQIPTRFGAVPVDEAPLGWEVETRRHQTKVTKFQHAYPTIRLPFQEVERVEFGHNDEFLKDNENSPKLKDLFPTGTNRLFFGDNLHIMRQLPSKSIDLIYIDPPFFSGREYNVLFGDKNEIRSFSDIWEGGMPGYLVWLNARLYEIKRLLKDTGSIYIHLDWHAVHYVKIELDKIFGFDNFQSEVIWWYLWGGRGKNKWSRKHDTILFYTKTSEYTFNYFDVLDDHTLVAGSSKNRVKYKGALVHHRKGKETEIPADKVLPSDTWYIPTINAMSKERIGYPTQKPKELLERIIKASSNEGDVVGDFFCGGGTTPAVAQRLNRRWIACDQSRIAVAITADRVARVVVEDVGNLFPVPDFTVEHWGVYEIPPLEEFTEDEFRGFVVKAFGGRPESVSPDIHGARHGVPLYVGKPSRKSRITKEDVARFAKAIFEKRRSNRGFILAWNFGRDARKAADILAARENKRIDFVRLDLVRLESDDFRSHVITKDKNYGELLRFIRPPQIRVKVKRTGKRKYRFDVSESVSLNKDGIIANVQWDFDHQPGRFISTQNYAYLRDKKTKMPVLVVEYTFPEKRTYTVACSVQDDQGGEQTEVIEVEVK